MPSKSKSQARFMFAAEARGEVKPGTARRWAHETQKRGKNAIKRLPEHVKQAAISRSLGRHGIPKFMSGLGPQGALTQARFVRLGHGSPKFTEQAKKEMRLLDNREAREYMRKKSSVDFSAIDEAIAGQVMALAFRDELEKIGSLSLEKQAKLGLIGRGVSRVAGRALAEKELLTEAVNKGLINMKNIGDTAKKSLVEDVRAAKSAPGKKMTEVRKATQESKQKALYGGSAPAKSVAKQAPAPSQAAPKRKSVAKQPAVPVQVAPVQAAPTQGYQPYSQPVAAAPAVAAAPPVPAGAPAVNTQAWGAGMAAAPPVNAVATPQHMPVGSTMAPAPAPAPAPQFDVKQWWGKLSPTTKALVGGAGVALPAAYIGGKASQ